MRGRSIRKMERFVWEFETWLLAFIRWAVNGAVAFGNHGAELFHETSELSGEGRRLIVQS